MNPAPPLSPRDFEVVRDPLWGTVRVDPLALGIIDTAPFQRLRHIRQLGLAYLVYPGATHSRFDHALGVYHLARWALGLLAERGELGVLDPAECRIIPYAALLHDIGHYPFSHALEELSRGSVPGHHEELTARFLAEPELRTALHAVSPDAPERIEALVRARSGSPLQGLVAGSLDLDKIEYLRRDARFCGVPYGEVDVDRLLHALTLVPDPETGRLEVGVHEKGLAALESLLFAKYQMFRNVYWHHTVRAATVLFKRLVRAALDAAMLTPDELVGQTDERLLTLLELRGASAAASAPAREVATRWLLAVRERRLPKRALELPGKALRGLPAEEWLTVDGEPLHLLEAHLARVLDLPLGGVFVDFPQKPAMLGLDLLMRERGGGVRRLTAGGLPGWIDLPRVADELYYSARVCRVFTVERRTLGEDELLPWLALGAEALRERLGGAAAGRGG